MELKTENRKKSYWVFFDVDETVINIKSMFSFLKYFYCQKETPFLGEFHYLSASFILKTLIRLGFSREHVNRKYYQFYRGVEKISLEKVGKNWFSDLLKKEHQLFKSQSLKAIEWHRKHGGEIVFVSGSFAACLEPIARYLGVEHVLCTRLEFEMGKHTGKIEGTSVIGQGKALLIQSFLKIQEYEALDRCFAYGDHISDLPMLNIVGNPVVVAGDRKLEMHAQAHGWSII